MTTPSATGSSDGLISASVGFEGANQLADVKLVQALLNLNPDAIGRLLSVDGKSGSKTIAAVKNISWLVARPAYPMDVSVQDAAQSHDSRRMR